jgi:hypothetical protein
MGVGALAGRIGRAAGGVLIGAPAVYPKAALADREVQAGGRFGQTNLSLQEPEVCAAEIGKVGQGVGQV